MKYIIRLCLVALFLFSLGLQSYSRDFPKQYTSAEKAEALSLLWSEVKYNFVFIDCIDFDIDSLYHAYMQKVLASRDDVEFMDLLSMFMASFGDGHTELGGYNFRSMDVYDSAPIYIENIGKKFYVSDIFDGAGIDSTWLGAEIIEVDGVPVMEYAEARCFPLYGGADVMKLIKVSSEIRLRYNNDTCSFRLKNRDGRIKDVTMTCNLFHRQQTDKRLGHWGWKGFNPMKRGRMSLDWDGDVAVLDFNYFHNDDIAYFDSLFNTVRGKASGLIIDLRNCPGGSSIVGDSLMTYIMDKDSVALWGWRTRVNNGYGRSQGDYREEYEDFYLYRAYETYPNKVIRLDRSKYVGCLVIILTSRFTASACETFLIGVVEHADRPLVVGERTQGSTGAPLVIDLPHGAWARVCTISHSFPVSGREFVNEGIEPDVKISPTVDDYLNGYDRCMDYALKKIREM